MLTLRYQRGGGEGVARVRWRMREEARGDEVTREGEIWWTIQIILSIRFERVNETGLSIDLNRSFLMGGGRTHLNQPDQDPDSILTVFADSWAKGQSAKASFALTECRGGITSCGDLKMVEQPKTKHGLDHRAKTIFLVLYWPYTGSQAEGSSIRRATTTSHR
jgi:hypothetical protein